MKTDYEKKADEFMTETGTTMQAHYTGRRKYFAGDTQARDVWSITLSNARGAYAFLYGDSLFNTEQAENRGRRTKPSAYSVLACLTKDAPENVDDFAADYGYTKPSEAIRVHKAIMREWEGVCELFNDAQIEKLREIQ